MSANFKLLRSIVPWPDFQWLTQEKCSKRMLDTGDPSTSQSVQIIASLLRKQNKIPQKYIFFVVVFVVDFLVTVVLVMVVFVVVFFVVVIFVVVVFFIFIFVVVVFAFDIVVIIIIKPEVSIPLQIKERAKTD